MNIDQTETAIRIANPVKAPGSVLKWMIIEVVEDRGELIAKLRGFILPNRFKTVPIRELELCAN